MTIDDIMAMFPKRSEYLTGYQPYMVLVFGGAGAELSLCRATLRLGAAPKVRPTPV